MGAMIHNLNEPSLVRKVREILPHMAADGHLLWVWQHRPRNSVGNLACPGTSSDVLQTLYVYILLH